MDVHLKPFYDFFMIFSAGPLVFKGYSKSSSYYYYFCSEENISARTTRILLLIKRVIETTHAELGN